MGIRVEKFKFCSKANTHTKKFFYFCLFCEFVNEDFKHMTTHIKQHFNESSDISVNTQDSIYDIKAPKRNKVGKEFLDYWSEEFLCNQYMLRKKSQLHNKFNNKAYIECPLCMKACKLLDEQDHHFTSVKEFESHFWKHCLREKVQCKLCGYNVRSSEQQSHLDMNHSGFDNEKNEYFYDRNHQSSFKFLQGLKNQCLLFYDGRLCRQFGINDVPVVNVDKINPDSMKNLIYPNIFTDFVIKLQKFDNVQVSSNICMNSDENKKQVFYKAEIKSINDKSYNILSMGGINSKISTFVNNKDSSEGILFKDKGIQIKGSQVNNEKCLESENPKDERTQICETLDSTEIDDPNEVFSNKIYSSCKGQIAEIDINEKSAVPNNIVEEDTEIKKCYYKEFKHKDFENLCTKYESQNQDNLDFKLDKLITCNCYDQKDCRKKFNKLKCTQNENNQIDIINVPDNFLHILKKNDSIDNTEQSINSNKASFHVDSSNNFNKTQDFTDTSINCTSLTCSGHDSPSSTESNFPVIPTSLMTPPPSNSSQDLVSENNITSLSFSFKERTIPNPYFQFNKEQFCRKRDKRVRTKASLSVPCLSSIKTARCSNKRSSFSIRSFFYGSHTSHDPYHWIVENDDIGYIKNPFAVNKDRPVPLDEVTVMYLRVMSHHSPFEASELGEELTCEDDDEISKVILIGSSAPNCDEGILNEFSEKAFFSLLSDDENNDINN